MDIGKKMEDLEWAKRFLQSSLPKTKQENKEDIPSLQTVQPLVKVEPVPGVTSATEDKDVEIVSEKKDKKRKRQDDEAKCKAVVALLRNACDQVTDIKQIQPMDQSEVVIMEYDSNLPKDIHNPVYKLHVFCHTLAGSVAWKSNVASCWSYDALKDSDLAASLNVDFEEYYHRLVQPETLFGIREGLAIVRKYKSSLTLTKILEKEPLCDAFVGLVGEVIIRKRKEHGSQNRKGSRVTNNQFTRNVNNNAIFSYEKAFVRALS